MRRQAARTVSAATRIPQGALPTGEADAEALLGSIDSVRHNPPDLPHSNSGAVPDMAAGSDGIILSGRLKGKEGAQERGVDEAVLQVVDPTAYLTRSAFPPVTASAGCEDTSLDAGVRRLVELLQRMEVDAQRRDDEARAFREGLRCLTAQVAVLSASIIRDPPSRVAGETGSGIVPAPKVQEPPDNRDGGI